MFSTLLSEKRKTATTNSTIYIFVMFLITTIYKSFRLYLNGYTPFNSLIDLSLNSMYGWLLYSVPPAIICGILGAILWSGRKNNIYSKILCILPVVFIFVESIILFYSFFINHTKLFSAITDLIWFALYVVFLKKGLNHIDEDMYKKYINFLFEKYTNIKKSSQDKNEQIDKILEHINSL